MSTPEENANDVFLRHVCLTYGSDHPSRREKAMDLLRTHPAIRGSSIHVAAAMGDRESLLRILRQRPALAHEKGGPCDWEPLLYLAYARCAFDASWHAPVEAARMLLEHGGDPNAGYLWDGKYLFTALTGIFGEGEAGPINQPPHPCCRDLALLLLQAGADPNDGQTLYNRQFTRGASHLELLLAHGLGQPSQGPWAIRLEGQLPSPADLLHDQLFWAAEHGHLDRVTLLVAQEMDLEARNRAGRTAYELALLNGHSEIAQLLAAQGALPVSLPPADQLEAACHAGHSKTARALLEKHPGLLTEIKPRQAKLLNTAAADNRLAAVRLMLELGFPVNALAPNSALHQAAWFGHLEMARLLVEAGADLQIRDPSHDARPVDWARYNQKAAVAEYLESAELKTSSAPSAQ